MSLSFNDVEQRILDEIDSRREELVDLCAKFVEAPSHNPPGNTAQVARLVHEYLTAHGLTPEIVAVSPEAPNIVVEVAGGQPGAHAVLNAHMDTMQMGDAAAWSVPPYELTRKDGRLYGLGMGNMKGGLAAMCMSMAVLGQSRDQLRGKVSFTAVSDEVMFGDRGTEYLLQARPDLAGDCMISAEGPGWMHFAVAEKGLLWIDVEANCEGGHSSRALRDRTAVARIAEFIREIDALNDVYATLPTELEGVSGGDDNLGLRLSANVGCLEAGPVRSLVAGRVTAAIDIRIPPGISIDALKLNIEELAGRFSGLAVRFPKEFGPSWAGLNEPLVHYVSDAAERIRGKAPLKVVRLPGSDARHWRDRGVPAVCYGPQPTLSAGVDDYAIEQDLIDCAKVYAIAALSICK